ncbi:MAG: neutral/alkaline non-lysosomal ceramidase N-terminal domain-containing protein [Opitutales bacterium]
MTLEAGFGAADITPPPDCPLIGYTQRVDLHPPGNAGVADPLFVRVVLLRDRAAMAQPLVLVSFDLCILEDPAVATLRADIGDLLGVRPAQIILAATHTHSGPYPWQDAWAEGAREPVPDILRGEASVAYWSALRAALQTALQAAQADLRPARLRPRRATLGFAYQRRVPTPKGIRMCWNPRESPELSPEPAVDDSLCLLQIQRDSGDLLLFNLAGHPVTLGKASNVVSADWPGAACRQIEAALPGARACFFHGAGADAHPWLATDKDPADCAIVARPVAGLVELLARAGGRAEHGSPLACAQTKLELKHGSIELTAWRVGQTRVLAVPGELFGESGRQLREACRDSGPLLLVTTANGWKGYLPPRSAFENSAYETDAVSGFGVGCSDAEKLVESALDLLATL